LLDAEVVFRNLRIAPFLVFADGQWKGSVEHGVQDVDKRHLAENNMEKIGAHIDHSAHQQAARAAALNGQFFRRGVVLRDQIFRSGNEICKGVLFLLHAPAVVPGLSEFAAAPNVRNGVDHAALQKTQAIRIEVHGHGDAIAAVAVKKQRRDRKSTRLNSSHVAISYAVFCLKKKKKNKTE